MNFWVESPPLMRELTKRAFHAMKWRGDWAEDDFAIASEMIQEAVKLLHDQEFDGSTWLLALYMRVEQEQERLDRLWPSPHFEHKGRIYSQGIEGRMLAAVAIWRLEVAYGHYVEERFDAAIDEVAAAGIALHYAGSADAYEDAEVNESFIRKQGAAKRWCNDPRQASLKEIRAEWERWQRHEVVYKGEAEFGRKMHAKYSEWGSDRSIAQRAAKWRKEAETSN